MSHLHEAWRRLTAASTQDIVQRLVDMNVVDVARDLFSPDYSAGDLMTEFDYEIEVKDSELEAVRQHIQRKSQDKLRSMGLGDPITVYRAGQVWPNEPMPTTLKLSTAETFKDMKGRDGSINEYQVAISKVLYYSEALWPYGSYAEEEVGVMGRDLQ